MDAQLHYLLTKTKEKAALLSKEIYHALWSTSQIIRRAQDDPDAVQLWGPSEDEIVVIAPMVTNDLQLIPDSKVGVHCIPGCQLWSKTDVYLLGKYATPVDTNGNLLAYAVLPEAYQHYLLHVDFVALHCATRKQWPRTLQHLPRAISLVNAWSQSYFHWFVEILPRIALLRHILPLGDDIHLVINSAPTAWQVRSLELLHYPVRRIVLAEDGPFAVKKFFIPAHVHQRLHNTGLYMPSMLTNLRKEIVDNLQQARHENQSVIDIYISRRRANGRNIVNEQELIHALAEHGFTAYCLEEMSLDEQIRLFLHAKRIIAPHGAGLTNILWANSVTVVELCGAYWNSSYLTLANTLNHRYLCYRSTDTRGRYLSQMISSKRDDFYVDVDHFINFLVLHT